MAKEEKICTATEISIGEKADAGEFYTALETLAKPELPPVIVCFCNGETVQGLFNASKTMNIIKKLIIIGRFGVLVYIH